MTDEQKVEAQSPPPAGAAEAGPAADAAETPSAIPADIYELGLIYKVDIGDDRQVTIDMTLTTPNCPSAAELPGQVEGAVAAVAGVRDAKVNIVWDPPWDPSRMSDEARTVLDMW